MSAMSRACKNNREQYNPEPKTEPELRKKRLLLALCKSLATVS